MCQRAKLSKVNKSWNFKRDISRGLLQGKTKCKKEKKKCQVQSVKLVFLHLQYSLTCAKLMKLTCNIKSILNDTSYHLVLAANVKIAPLAVTEQNYSQPLIIEISQRKRKKKSTTNMAWKEEVEFHWQCHLLPWGIIWLWEEGVTQRDPDCPKDFEWHLPQLSLWISARLWSSERLKKRSLTQLWSLPPGFGVKAGKASRRRRQLLCLVSRRPWKTAWFQRGRAANTNWIRRGWRRRLVDARRLQRARASRSRRVRVLCWRSGSSPPKLRSGWRCWRWTVCASYSLWSAGTGAAQVGPGQMTQLVRATLPWHVYFSGFKRTVIIFASRFLWSAPRELTVALGGESFY